MSKEQGNVQGGEEEARTNIIAQWDRDHLFYHSYSFGNNKLFGNYIFKVT